MSELDLQPQDMRTMYPTIDINVDSTKEWYELTGDRSDKFDEIEKINKIKCNQIKKNIESALKLQELVKERIENDDKLLTELIKRDKTYKNVKAEHLVYVLGSLVKESQTTLKEEGDST